MPYFNLLAMATVENGWLLLSCIRPNLVRCETRDHMGQVGGTSPVSRPVAQLSCLQYFVALLRRLLC